MTLTNDDGYPYCVNLNNAYRNEPHKTVTVMPDSSHHFDLPPGMSATVSTLETPVNPTKGTL